MPTRIVGTCCCGTPPFELYIQIWAQVDFDFAYQGNCSSCATTNLSAIPAQFQREITYYPGGSTTGTRTYVGDWGRTSRVTLALSPNLTGGADGDSFDPDDWVALFVNVTDAAFTFSDGSGVDRTIVGAPMSNIEMLTDHIKLSSGWTRTFTYDGTTYRVTIPSGKVLWRDAKYRVSTSAYYDDGDTTSAMSYYMRYEIADVGSSNFTIERVSSGSGLGSGSGS